jgi:hypothetical protein
MSDEAFIPESTAIHGDDYGRVFFNDGHAVHVMEESPVLRYVHLHFLVSEDFACGYGFHFNATMLRQRFDNVFNQSNSISLLTSRVVSVN